MQSAEIIGVARKPGFNEETWRLGIKIKREKQCQPTCY